MDSRTALLNATRPRRRVVAVLAPVLLAAAVAAVALGTYSSLRARAEALTERRLHLGRLQMLLVAVPKTSAEDALAIATDAGPEFLPGASEALVQAAFQTRLNAIATASGAELLAVGNTPIVERSGARFAGLRASLSGTNDAIVETIFAIEASVPYLMIRSATIDSYEASADRAADAPQELLLQVAIEGALPPDGAPDASEAAE
jgi:hypothetical protein